MEESLTIGQQGEAAKDFMAGLIRKIGLDADIEVRELDEETVEVAAAGDNLGLLVGPRGATLVGGPGPDPHLRATPVGEPHRPDSGRRRWLPGEAVCRSPAVHRGHRRRGQGVGLRAGPRADECRGPQGCPRRGERDRGCPDPIGGG